MRYLITLSLIAMTLFLTSAQDSIDCFFFPIENQSIFRGVDNEVRIQFDNDEIDLELSCPYCDTFYLSNKHNTYVIRETKAKFVKILILDTSNLDKTLGSIEIPIVNLPSPMLYIGGSMNGTKLDRNATKFNLKSIHNDKESFFSIEHWKVIIGENVFTGSGENLTDELIEELKSGRIKDGLAAIVYIKGPLGITRVLGAAFTA